MPPRQLSQGVEAVLTSTASSVVIGWCLQIGRCRTSSENSRLNLRVICSRYPIVRRKAVKVKPCLKIGLPNGGANMVFKGHGLDGHDVTFF